MNIFAQELKDTIHVLKIIIWKNVIKKNKGDHVFKFNAVFIFFTVYKMFQLNLIYTLRCKHNLNVFFFFLCKKQNNRTEFKKYDTFSLRIECVSPALK